MPQGFGACGRGEPLSDMCTSVRKEHSSGWATPPQASVSPAVMALDPRPSVPSSQGLGCLVYPWHTAHSQAASGLHFLLNSATVLWGLPASRFSPLHPPGLSSSNKYIASHKAFPHPAGSALTSATAGHVAACHLLPSVHPALQPSPALPKSPAVLWILLLCSCQNPLMQFPTPASLHFHWERIQKSPPSPSFPRLPPLNFFNFSSLRKRFST